uniref:Uncharacterized protein n=1 Tax=Sphaeramia orbicularis TaxID=375764 RepID=A0A673C932_9TELE
MELNNARRASSAGYRLPERSNGTRPRTTQAPAAKMQEPWEFIKKKKTKLSEEPLPSYVSLFSDRIPNTSNQMLGSRLSTSLGNELVRLDRLLLWSDSHRKRKQDPEMLPC